MTEQETPQKKNVIARFQSFLHNSKRIFKISHKPTKKEYWMMTKISIVGFLILGVIAFIIHQIIVAVDPVIQV
jgi:protein translocase SEC61 complex gamma subunit